MPELRPDCEWGDRDLPPETPDVRICSFECTFCQISAEQILAGRPPTVAANWCGDRFGQLTLYNAIPLQRCGTIFSKNSASSAA